MKTFLLFGGVLIPGLMARAQDTLVEPKQTSTQNYDLLLIAVVGLIILIGLYFLFRKTRRR